MTWPWISSLLFGLAVALAALFAYRQASRPERIATARDRVLARLLEIFLYRDSLRCMGRACGRLVAAFGGYGFVTAAPLGFAALCTMPLLLLSIPFVQHRACEVGESVLVDVRLRGPAGIGRLALESGGGGLEEGPTVRIPAEARVIRRFSAREAGTWNAVLRMGADEVFVPISVVERGPAMPSLYTSGPLGRLPGVGALDSPAKPLSVSIDYPDWNVAGSSWLTGPVLVVVFALAFAAPLAVAVRPVF